MLLGGLLAGAWITVSEAVLNGLVLMDPDEMPLPSEPAWSMGGYVVGTFVFGFAVAWLYAATRPRFGPGWRTGAIAGSALWLVGYVVPTIWMGAMGLSRGAGVTAAALLWGLGELVTAGVLAGWLYREDPAGVA